MYSIKPIESISKVEVPNNMYHVNCIYDFEHDATKDATNNDDFQEVLRKQEDLIKRLSLIEEKLKTLPEIKSENSASIKSSETLTPNICIHVHVEYRPEVIFELINLLRDKCGLVILTKLYFHSTCQSTKDWTEHKIFNYSGNETGGADFNVSFVVHRYEEEREWLNNQPYLILNAHHSIEIFGEIAISQYLVECASKINQNAKTLIGEGPLFNRLQEYLIYPIDSHKMEIKSLLNNQNLKDNVILNIYRKLIDCR